MQANEKIDVLLAEYSVLYKLLLTRIHLIERRAPVATATLAVALGSVVVLPSILRAFVLLTLPLLSYWLFRATTSHARSKEDILRRIDEIERHVNFLAEDELLIFQSQHPNRVAIGASRSVRDTLASSAVAALLLLIGSCVVAVTELPEVYMVQFTAYATITGLAVMNALLSVQHYKYRKSCGASNPPVALNCAHPDSPQSPNNP